jgi:hypothetical protein
MKGAAAMKILEIKDNRAYFRAAADQPWQEIDSIDREGLLRLLDVLLTSDVEMDLPDEKKLSNQAQQIIYKSIFEKFNSLRENKSRFKDDSDRKYLRAIEKYSGSTINEEPAPK